MIEPEEFGSASRRMVLTVLVFSAFVTLFVRLYQLQLLYHVEFGKESEKNSVRAVVRDPVRGYMFDRNGKLVVDVGPFYSVTVTPSEFDTSNTEYLAMLLDMDSETIRDRVNRGRAISRFAPVRVKRDVDFKTLSSIEEHLFLMPGVSYDVETKRVYTSQARAPHLLGYCKEITDVQLARAGSTYQQGDIIGSAGLEAYYETFLRGEKGYEFISINSKGHVLGSLDDGKRDILPKEGFDLVLSADFDVQTFAESLMTNYRGALVAMDPNTGGILALVCKPDFDPSVLSGVTPADEWNRLNSDPDKPLFNRATMTRYPPGSTIKMMLAAAALQEGIIDEHYRITCYGAFRFGNRIFKDTHIHGSTNIVEAIQKSCNVFFYQLILKVGFDKWVEYAHRFGFGEATGFDLGEEVTGLIPTPEYYDRVYGKGKWTLGNLVSLGIGQGEIGVSPLQMARYAAALANGGILLRPHSVDRIRNKRTNRMDAVEDTAISIGIDKHNMDLIREGMRRCVESPGGTGSLARIPGIVSAGKTGTAQNPHGEDHSWYVGFAPFNNPRIAIAVLIENAGFGGTKAAPVAGLVMEKYLFGEIKRNIFIPGGEPGARRDSAVASVGEPRR